MLEEVKQAGSGKLDEFQLRDELRALRTQIPDTPYLNPIVSVAFNLSRRLEGGEISFDELQALAVRLMDRACVQRGRHLRERVGFVDRATTYEEFANFVETEAKDVDFETFKARWSRPRTGIVLTAHPTFGLSEALTQRMVEIAVANDVDPNTPIGYAHRPDDNIDLGYEHRRAQTAIHNLRNAYSELLHSFYTAAVARFGDQAYTINPRLATMASWVGYDLDGRTDISWITSFIIRLQEKRAGFIDVHERIQALRDSLSRIPETQLQVRQLTGKLDLAIAAVDAQIAALEEVVKGGQSLADAANVITSEDYNITSIAPITDLLKALIATTQDPQIKRSVAVIVGLMEATGLGTSHIHLRINALQLNNAFRAFVHEPWTRDLRESQALSRIVEMIEQAKHETVNFETLELETATAIRQFALIAQIQKHVDQETPIRFLIAETESPATVLIAVFFATLLGVDHITDVSPLFENAAGLEGGARIIEHLLDQKAYRDYVQKRGRIAYQTGFSDAGRFVGQITATLAVERLHHNVADAIHRVGLKDIETLIFSTHGESMGRGAHPGEMRTRLNYLFPPQARRKFANYQLRLKHETSFQGGDGYMFFGNNRLTTRTLSTVIMDGVEPPEGDDPFYEDGNLAYDFLLRLKSYQEHLFEHPGYRAVLGAFGPNLLFKTGSRPVRRQTEGATVDRGDPARMRAIPNNAILQQFGYIANVVAGLSAAVGSERTRFVELARRSPRLRPLIEMIGRAKQLSSLNAMGANAIVFDPGFWAWRASWGRESHLEYAFSTLASRLLSDDRCGAINGLVHHLRLDAVDLHGVLEEIGIEGGKIPDDHRLELDLLHAIRLAFIMRIFILAAQMPRSSSRNEVSFDQVFEWALALNVPEVTSEMRQAFPHHARSSDAAATRFQERASYRPHGIDDYGRVETEILEPMERAYEMVREIGTGISHHWGAFG